MIPVKGGFLFMFLVKGMITRSRVFNPGLQGCEGGQVLVFYPGQGRIWGGGGSVCVILW